jgi:hypothetical protein
MGEVVSINQRRIAELEATFRFHAQACGLSAERIDAILADPEPAPGPIISAHVPADDLSGGANNDTL